jgi:PAS domain S-box-containing protein
MKPSLPLKANASALVTKAHAHRLERFELLNHVTEDGIWDYDLESKKVYYNPAFCRLFGYSQKEMKNNALWWNNSLHPDEQTEVIRSFHQTLEGSDNKWQMSYRLRCKNGLYKYITDRIYIQRNDSGKALRIIGSIADLSNKTNTHSQADSTRNEERRIALMEALAANEQAQKQISYELNESVNQLLASVKLYVGEVKNHVTAEGLTFLQKSEENLNTAITEIYALSKKISPREIEILGLQAAFEEAAGSMSTSKKIKLHFNIHPLTDALLPPTLKTVLYRVFVILADNAYRHAACTGIWCTAGFEAGRVCLRVKDNGKGFDAEKIKFGLGFTRMKMVAEIMNGHYLFEKGDEGGSNIRFCLPFEKN